jgi:hypothetical protein
MFRKPPIGLPGKQAQVFIWLSLNYNPASVRAVWSKERINAHSPLDRHPYLFLFLPALRESMLSTSTRAEKAMAA